MPPKSSISSTSSHLQLPSTEQLAAIQNYLVQKPDFNKLIAEAKRHPTVDTRRDPTESGKASKAAFRDTLADTKHQVEADGIKQVNMPVGKKEEQTEGSKF